MTVLGIGKNTNTRSQLGSKHSVGTEENIDMHIYRESVGRHEAKLEKYIFIENHTPPQNKKTL
jgi:hypothetical protein